MFIMMLNIHKKRRKIHQLYPTSQRKGWGRKSEKKEKDSIGENFSETPIEKKDDKKPVKVVRSLDTYKEGY